MRGEITRIIPSAKRSLPLNPVTLPGKNSIKWVKLIIPFIGTERPNINMIK
jgi:hypothetical protein